MILDANLIYMQNSINIVNVIRVIFMVILSYYSNYKIKNEEIVINKKFIVKIILIGRISNENFQKLFSVTCFSC